MLFLHQIDGNVTEPRPLCLEPRHTKLWSDSSQPFKLLDEKHKSLVAEERQLRDQIFMFQNELLSACPLFPTHSSISSSISKADDLDLIYCDVGRYVCSPVVLT